MCAHVQFQPQWAEMVSERVFPDHLVPTAYLDLAHLLREQALETTSHHRDVADQGAHHGTSLKDYDPDGIRLDCQPPQGSVQDHVTLLAAFAAGMDGGLTCCDCHASQEGVCRGTPLTVLAEEELDSVNHIDHIADHIVVPGSGVEENAHDH